MEIKVVSFKELINILKKDYNNLIKDKEFEKFLKEIAPKAFGEGFVPFEELPLKKEWIYKLYNTLVWEKIDKGKFDKFDNKIGKLAKILKTVYTLAELDKLFAVASDMGVYESNGIVYIPEFKLYHYVPQINDLLKGEEPQKVVELLTSKYLSPYHFSRYYKENFLPILSKLNNKDDKFFFNLLLRTIFEKSMKILSKYTYESLKEVGVPDSVIARAEFTRDYNGVRSYVIASLKTGKERVPICNIKVLEDEFIRNNVDRLRIGFSIDFPEEYKEYYNELETYKAKLAYLYLLSKTTKDSKILNLVGKHLSELSSHLTEEDRKIAKLLVKTVLKDNKPLFDKITKFKNRSKSFLRFIEIAAPVNSDMVDVENLKVFLTKLNSKDKTRLFNSLSKDLLAMLDNKTEISQKNNKSSATQFISKKNSHKR